MAADYTNMLSLNRASLVGRERLNHLGSQELVFDYTLQTSNAKEGAVDWLEANRLTLTDPQFANRTYSGTYQCVSISYNDKTNVIRQRFKIDSMLENDVSQRSAAGDTLKSYYWRIVDPTEYNIPDYKSTGTSLTPNISDSYWYDTGTTENSQTVYYDKTEAYALWNDGSKWVITTVAGVGESLVNYFHNTSITGNYTAVGTYSGTPTVNTLYSLGETWTKSAIDNGDGTYDVTITTYSSTEYTGSSSTETKFYTETTVVTLNDAAETQPTWEVGKTVAVTNVPLENGLYRTTVVTRTAKQKILEDFDFWSDWDITTPCQIITFHNYTAADLQTKLTSLSVAFVNSPSVRMNEFGLFDGAILRR